ncbi:PR-1-like protein [Massarina eburnea CBS 473.64]|uniref:PR-1-like protein n=1 Tax=Massarina eburnea CBS 473.64 TaxID=1395130 RepID=A0A6A6S2R4_9PLEO|nr:PR-1-like protein [Massarina eburnea CBS 473.64]
MRSSVLLTSALAAGAIAGPIERRKVYTETQVTVETITVYIPSSSAPSSSATPTSSAVPTTTVAPTTSAAPTTTAAPTSSSSSQAAAATSSSALAYGVTHTSGTVQATFHEGDEYKNSVLWHHNRARANHGASNLEWSDECESAAQTAAAYCDFEHHVVDGQGQNLFTTSGDAYNVTAGITDSWYKGEADIYTWWGEEPPHSSSDSASLDMETFEKYGHTTQMLWKSTTSVGCVTIDCGSKMTVSGASSTMGKYTVCNYSPPGNYVGEFAKNVAAPSGAYSGYSWSD